jgi:hypothetical protein
VNRQLNLRLLPELYGIAQLDASSSIPNWADGAGFLSISRSDDELSIVCRQVRIPDSVQSSSDWVCLKLEGPFGLDESGIVSSVIAPLAVGNIGVFVVSTYDGDHLLVQERDIELSKSLLIDSGHQIIGKQR